MPIVTPEQAVAHLRIPIALGLTPPDPAEADLRLKLAAAEAIILDYLKPKTGVDVPTYQGDPLVQAAILIELGELYRFRGDDPENQGSDQDPERGELSPMITNILRRYRDPAIA